MTYASVGCKLPLDGLQRNAQRLGPNCFHADKPKDNSSNKPTLANVNGWAVIVSGESKAENKTSSSPPGFGKVTISQPEKCRN